MTSASLKHQQPKQEAPSIDIVRTTLYNNANDVRNLLVAKANEKCELVQSILSQEDPATRRALLRSLPTHQMVIEEIMEKMVELDTLVIRLEKAEKISLQSV